MKQTVLVLNAGSSSLKFALYDAHQLNRGTGTLLRGQIADIGQTPRAELKQADDALGDAAATLFDTPVGHDHATLTDWLLQRLQRLSDRFILCGVGHRVVHGGQAFEAPVIISPRVLDQLKALIPLAPLHQPHNLAPIEAITGHFADVPQIACFDTAFHRTQPELAELFALPRRHADQGILRYGFHGLSYDYIALQLPEHLPPDRRGRVVVAHLGHGASLCALNDGRSIATTMGFTALDGLPMATRCGALDAGVVLHLIQEKGMSPSAVSDLLYKQSGLLGLSGRSADMRTLLAADDAHSRQAIDYFCYHIACWIGALAAALGGLDALVFTAGIGENQPQIRARVVQRSAWLGAQLDPAGNDANARCISAADSAVTTLVLPTNEEWMIARHTLTCLGLF